MSIDLLIMQDKRGIVLTECLLDELGKKPKEFKRIEDLKSYVSKYYAGSDCRIVVTGCETDFYLELWKDDWWYKS